MFWAGIVIMPKEQKKLGFKVVETKKVLGDHDSAPTVDIAYSKYFEYTQKIRKFKSNSSARKFSESMRLRFKRERNEIAEAAYRGSIAALSGEVRNHSKRENVEDKMPSIKLKYSTPKEAFMVCKKAAAKMIREGNISGAKRFARKLQRKWKQSGEYIDKKAFNGAGKALSKVLVVHSEDVVPNIRIGVIIPGQTENPMTEGFYLYVLDMILFSKLIGIELIPIIIGDDNYIESFMDKTEIVYLNYKDEFLSNKLNYGTLYLEGSHIDGIIILTPNSFMCKKMFIKYRKSYKYK